VRRRRNWPAAAAQQNNRVYDISEIVGANVAETTIATKPLCVGKKRRHPVLQLAKEEKCTYEIFPE
jgi:hypothetical protein